MTNIITPTQLLSDFTRDLADDRAKDGTHTPEIIAGYAVTLQSMLDAARREGCADMGAAFFGDHSEHGVIELVGTNTSGTTGMANPPKTSVTEVAQLTLKEKKS